MFGNIHNMSSTKSIDEAPTKPTNEVQEQKSKDADADAETFNPRSLKFITIMISMYMSVFLVALVSRVKHFYRPF